MDEQRKLLDELMGQDRDLPPEQNSGKRRKFSDPEVCKYYLCGLSPYYAFKNTKSANDVYKHLGSYYDKLCDEDCKAEWEALPQKEKDKYGYEHDLLVLLGKLIVEGDRKVDRSNERVNRENAPTPLTESEKKQVDEWTAEIKKLTEESDKAAEEGEVDAAETAIIRLDVVKKMKEDLERSKYPDKQLSVCPVSGVFLSSADSEQRRNDHLSGKQYMGWKAIRDKYAQLKEQNPPPLSRDRDRERGGRGGGDRDNRYRDRDGGHRYRGGGDRYRDGDRDRYRGRDHRYDDRGRDRDRRDYRRGDRDRSRSRSRERYRR